MSTRFLLVITAIGVLCAAGCSVSNSADEQPAIVPIEFAFNNEGISLWNRANQGEAEFQYKLGLYYYNRAIGIHDPFTRDVPYPRQVSGRSAFVSNAINQERNNRLRAYWDARNHGYRHSSSASYLEAAKWFGLAAAAGHRPAMARMGDIHAFGEGIDRDVAEARRWWSLSQQAPEGTQARLPREPDWLSDDDKHLWPAAYGGNAEAQRRLAFLYSASDKAMALRWHHRAGKQGDVTSQDRLGSAYVYWDAFRSDQNYTEAAIWYQLASEQGNSRSQRTLAQLLLHPHFRGERDEEAVKWFRELEKGTSSSSERAHARFQLGELYREGRGVSQDGTEALRYYRLALQGGDHRAERAIQEMEKNSEKDSIAESS